MVFLSEKQVFLHKISLYTLKSPPFLSIIALKRLFCYIFLIQTSTALSPLPDKCTWNRIYSKGGILLWQHGKISTLLLLTANLPN